MKYINNTLIFIFILTISCFSNAGSFSIKKEGLLKANRILYNHDTNFLEAEGNVTIINGDIYIKTNRAYVDVASKKIWIDEEVYADNKKEKLLANYLYYDQKNEEIELRDAKLMLNEADFLVAKNIFIGNNQEAKITDASYSPCKKCINNKPIWQITSQKTTVDFQNKQISYRNATFLIGGYKVAYFPYFSHPMPNAPAKTGFLRPEIDHDTLKTPFYFKIAPNMDITYTPRLNRKLLIHELEFRHLIESGEYSFNGSYTNSETKTSGLLSSNKNKELDRFHIQTNGKFHSDIANYGYKYEKVSDKSYLKNYYDDHKSFLKSEIYISKLFNSGYIYSDIQKYQGLRIKDTSATDPQILPSVNIRKDIYLENEIDLTVKNKSINYIEKDKKNISRNSFSLKLNKDFFASNGSVANIGIYNQYDVYQINMLNLPQKYLKNKQLYKNSPELQSGLSIPFISSSNENTVLIEPQFSLIIGKKAKQNINQYVIIDSPNLDINDNNIFEDSRYSGIDFRENGTRFSYGINKLITNQNTSISAFIGQLLRSNSNSGDSRSNYIGKISINHKDNFNFYYKFQKKNKLFDPYRDEIFAEIRLNKLSISNNYTALREIQKYLALYQIEDSVIISKDSIKQNYSSISYDFTKNFQGFADLKIDLPQKNKASILSDGFGFNYKFDCISLTSRISNDYTYDPSRNIKKTRSYTLKLGLKTINM